MRGFRLNGWQRLGIVLSVLWLIVGTIWAYAADQTTLLCKGTVMHLYDKTSGDVPRPGRTVRARSAIQDKLGSTPSRTSRIFLP